ncbi:caspase family protein [Streptomyces sp. NPDC056921]|uniref:caspase, EACC1-associated type n=1 Tax=Streptomyces sp. NPDC056921 TaxID=3345966 RepID=UPI00362A7F72
MAESQRYRGLLIGNATFPRDPHALPALNGPLDDIAELRQVLTDPQVGLFDPADLEALPDHGIQDLREKVDDLFTTATRGDVLLLYYSGHGQLDERGILYLCANDSRTAGLRASALSAIEINNIIDGSPAASTVVILDCCYSGAFKGTAPSAPVAGRGRYVLTSSRSTQLARAADRPGQPSPFTRQLVRALRTAPSDKADGHLTVAEVYRQVHHWMTADTVIAPQLRFAGEGDVAIARRPIPPRPAPLRKTEPPSAMHLLPSSPDKARAAGGTPARVDPPSVSPLDAQRAPASPAQLADSQGGTKRRRRGLSLIVVGVVVVSLAVYAGTQLPGDRNDDKGTADGKPDQTSTLKPSADGSASPGRSPRTSITATPHQTAGSGSTASGGSTGGGSSNSGNSSNGGGTGTDPTKGAAGGSSKGGSSGDSNTAPSSPATLSPGSVSRLKNAATHQCVSADDSVYPSIGTCSSSDTYTWKLRPSDGDTFELVNRASGHCLAAPYANDSSAVTTRCGDDYSGGYVHWRVETITAAGQTLKNTETNRCLEIDSTPYNGVRALVTTCNSDEPQQLWTRD